MAKPGPKKTPPALRLVRGNPGHRPIEPGVKLPPAELTEPDWAEVLGGGLKETAIGTAELCAFEWARVVPQLTRHGVLTEVDAALVEDYCISRARLIECERHISHHGLAVEGERGWQKNPSVTAANQYRTALRFMIGELGLGPSTRGTMQSGKSEGDDEMTRAAGILD